MNVPPSCVACRVADAEVAFFPRKLVRPLVLSSGRIDDVAEARATVTVETVDGRRAMGHGAIYLSDLWAWPDPQTPHEVRERALIDLTQRIAAELPQVAAGQTLHPLELGLRLHAWAMDVIAAGSAVPALARAMCASPFDAAIHDAVGIALGRSAFELFDDDTTIPSADRYFPAGGTVAAIRRVIQRPRRELPAWLIVNKTDVLPSELSSAYARHGYRSFKLKVTGSDNAVDAARTAEVFQAARQLGIARPTLTIDSNEANPDAASVLDYLERLREINSDAYQALAYIEQPTARDIVASPFDWHAVARQKPVLVDEGLTDLSVLEVAREQGWSGFALKTCKGHSMLLTAAAWALERGMVLSLQDLTNPGIALVHGALVGAHLPTINGAELNSPQFTPEANTELFPRLRDLAEPRDGLHRLPHTTPAGLGSQWVG